MTNLGQLLTKKIKITPRTQDLNLKVSVLNVLCTSSLPPGGCTETHRYIYTYTKCKIAIILVADPQFLENSE